MVAEREGMTFRRGFGCSKLGAVKYSGEFLSTPAAAGGE